MKRTLLLLLMFLGGCATPKVGIPPDHVGPVASLKGNLAGPVEFFAGKEAHCQIQSIDGSKVGSSYKLLPGKHTVVVYLSNMGKEYVGDVELTIPEAKSYRLTAKRDVDVFTLSLVDSEAGRVVANSTAEVNQRMRFYTFVVLP